MDKSDYTDNAKTLLNDTNTYLPLDSDPNTTTVSRVNKKLKDLKNQEKPMPMIKSDKMRQQSLNSTGFHNCFTTWFSYYNLWKYFADVLKLHDKYFTPLC